jgi:2-polyprenyl-3-methyl-5-hydroxy-6-metoxy-1,4-benzoquinol methylase
MASASNLRNERQGAAERFVPGEMSNTVTEAEHVARYTLAASLAPGRRVLDAGCGVGYGADLIARAGAATVVGVDVAPEAIEAARQGVDGRVQLLVADLRALPFGDGAFDLAVCFEVIEHLAEQDLVLDEMRRVLAVNGLLIVSTPNPRVYPGGNPHHVRELTPEELAAMLGARFEHVGLLRQHNWMTSAILRDEAFSAHAYDVAVDIEARKIAGGEPGHETYTIGLASRTALPASRDVAVLGAPAEFRQVQEELRDVLDVVSAKEAQLVDLYAERRRLELEVERLVNDVSDLRSRLEQAERTMQGMESSLSWRVTAPLRAAKRTIR